MKYLICKNWSKKENIKLRDIKVQQEIFYSYYYMGSFENFKGSLPSKDKCNI